MLQNIIARRILVVLALVSAPALLAAFTLPNSSSSEAAHFHLTLKRAEPAANDTVATSPSSIKLWFTESVTSSTVAVRLTDARDAVVKLGEVSVESAPMSPAVVPVPATLAAGTYTVAWRAMADDGHPSNGKFSFTVK